MHRRISPILIAAALLSGGFPTRRKEDEEPAKDPQSPPERDDLPASPGTRTVSEIYERRYGRDLFAALERRPGDLLRSSSVTPHHEPRQRPAKRPHAPRDRAAQRAAKKIKSAAKKRRGR